VDVEGITDNAVLIFNPPESASIFSKINAKQLKSGKIMGLWRMNDKIKNERTLGVAASKIIASYFFGSF